MCQEQCQIHLLCPHGVTVDRRFLGMFAGEGDGWASPEDEASDTPPAPQCPGTAPCSHLVGMLQ